MEKLESTLLQEYWEVGQKPLRVDRRYGIIRGVKLLGLRSRNGRVYLPQALAEARSLYEGAKVNVNHAPGPAGGVRDYRDRIGLVRNVRFVDGEGLFGDLHYNPKHALAEQLAWDAEHLPENVGLSHNVLAQVRRQAEETIVETIVHVYSVDLVADPASTTGLFEGLESPVPASDTSGQSTKGDCRCGQCACCEFFAARSGQFRPCSTGGGECREQKTQTRPSVDEIEQLREKLAHAERTLAIWRAFAEFGLPLPGTGKGDSQLVDDEFVSKLYALDDEAEVRRLVGRKAQILRDHKLLFGGQASSAASTALGGETVDLRQFLQAICEDS